jgi:O-antigen/teichoic acid export membrane protein
MARGVHIKRNSFFAFLSSFVRLLANAILFIIVARVYGPVEFGQLTASYTTSAIFLLFADFGFDMLLTWEVARRRGDASEIAHKYFSSKLLFATSASAVMAITTTLTSVSNETHTLMWIFSGYVFVSALANFCYALFRGFEQFQLEARITFVVNLLMLIAVVVIGSLHGPLFIVALVFVFSRVLALVMGIFVSRGLVAITRFRFVFPSREDLSRIAVFGFHAIFATLFFQQDTILLSIWRGDRDVGIYQAAFKLIVVIFIIPDVLLTTLLPTLTRAFEEDYSRWEELGRLLNKTLLLVGLPAVVVLWTSADLVIPLVFGPDTFGEAVPVLQLFAGATFLHFASISYALMLTTSRRQSARLMVVVFATILNFSLNAYLIPHLGPRGAAIASCVTLAFVGIGYVLPWRRLFVRWVSDIRYVLPLLVAGGLGVCIIVGRAYVGWVVVPPMVVIVAVLLPIVGYTREERRLLLGIRRSATVSFDVAPGPSLPNRGSGKASGGDDHGG